MDFLRRSLLDLLYELRGVSFPLTVGGGFGLFLKRLQRDMLKQRTLFQELPQPRATNDLDLFIRVEVLADYSRMHELAQALQRLGYEVIQEAKFLQWKRTLVLAGRPHEVKVDFLVGPLGELRSALHVKKPRVRPRQSIDLHAYNVEEALRIEEEPLGILLDGQRTSGDWYRATVYVPQAFPYLLMKLSAFADRKNDPNRELGRHHALDVYTLVGLLTEGEYESARKLGMLYHENKHVARVRRILAEDFSAKTALGMLRLQEHPLCRPDFRLEEMISVLREIFPGSG